MQKIPITLAAPGMVLAKPIMNDKGMPLCAEGTQLTDTLLERLRAMNIPAVTVKGSPIDNGAPVKTPEERIAEMRERFTHVKGDLMMDRIRDAIAQAIAAEAAENAALEAAETGEAPQ